MIRLPLLGCTLHTLKHCSIWRYRNSDGDVHGMEKKLRWEPPAWEVRHVLGAEETKQENPNKWCNFPTVLLGVYPYCSDLWVAGSFLWSRYGVLDSQGWSWTCRAESWASDPPSSTQSVLGLQADATMPCLCGAEASCMPGKHYTTEPHPQPPGHFLVFLPSLFSSSPCVADGATYFICAAYPVFSPAFLLFLSHCAQEAVWGINTSGSSLSTSQTRPTFYRYKWTQLLAKYEI